MGKKNKNANVNTDAVEVEVAEAEVEAKTEEMISEEAKVEEPTPAPVEEVKEEAPVEEVVEETPSVEEPRAEEPVEVEAPVAEAEVVNANDTVISQEVLENAVEEPAPAAAEVKVVAEDEEPLGPVDYFVQINKEPFTDEKLAMVEARLDKYELARFVSAEGIVLVGPYATKDGAINGRRLVIRCGLKGDIVEIPKD